MNTLLGWNDIHVSEPFPAETPVREASPCPVATISSVRGDQINALVQQLFFQRDPSPLRHVGFASVDASSETAPLCLEVAMSLAGDGRYDIAIVDGNPSGVPLQSQLQISSSSWSDAPWPIARRLWMVPRQSWLPDASCSRITNHNLALLRELTSRFDFSILWCAPVSWLTASIGQSCDGLVLVLTANKTRRLVATQIKNQLEKAQIPLLGTVLAERRFPVPAGLYRSL